MAFTAKDVQALREKTGCGMMDCKKALVECDGNMDAAVDYLREKGLASQAKKENRIAAEGTVCAICENGVGVAVELNAETDFVAGGDEFKELALKVARVIAAQAPADVDALNACVENGQTVEEMVQELFLKVRENIKIRRFIRYEGDVVTYIHGGGRIGVLATEVTLREEKFDILLHRFNEECTIAKIPAPGLVQLIEAGKVDTEETEALLRSILKDYIGKLDALVLGCTHYPFAAKAISRVLGNQTVLLEGGGGTARETRRRLAEAGLLEEGAGEIRILNSAEDENMIRLSWQRLKD